MSRSFKPLTSAEVKKRLQKHPRWRVGKNKITIKLEFANFVEAFAFLKKVAKVAEEVKHHPNIYNSYKIVRLEIFTHDIEGLSTADVRLVQELDPLIHDSNRRKGGKID